MTISKGLEWLATLFNRCFLFSKVSNGILNYFQCLSSWTVTAPLPLFSFMLLILLPRTTEIETLKITLLTFVLTIVTVTNDRVGGRDSFIDIINLTILWKLVRNYLWHKIRYRIVHCNFKGTVFQVSIVLFGLFAKLSSSKKFH